MCSCLYLVLKKEFWPIYQDQNVLTLQYRYQHQKFSICQALIKMDRKMGFLIWRCKSETADSVYIG